MRGRRTDGAPPAGGATVAYRGSPECRCDKGRGRRGHFPDDDLWRGSDDRGGTQDLQGRPRRTWTLAGDLRGPPPSQGLLPSSGRLTWEATRHDKTCNRFSP